MTLPPSQAPTALATLKAECSEAAAIVWPPCATSIKRDCTAGAAANPQPSRKTDRQSATGEFAKRPKPVIMTMLNISVPPIEPIKDLSARQEPKRLPAFI